MKNNIHSIKLEKLNNNNLEEMCRIGDETFPYEIEKPSYFFRKSLKENLLLIKSEGQTCDYAQYYAIMLDNKVIGTSGLYHLKGEPKTTAWLGWFCLDPNYRGKGYATIALQKTFDIAKIEGKTKMKLYTSNRPNEEAAQYLYEKMGLKIYKEIPDGNFKCIYRRRRLI